ncbi:uncharacterized protein M421DRAFT_75370, partial [Didymella exigua CBS 183.55]
GFLKLIKGAKEILYKNILIKACVRELEEQLAVITKRKLCKRKQIQHSGILEYGLAASRVAAEACVSTVQRCRNYSKTGHNAQTCQEGAETSSKSNASTQYARLLFNSK